MGYQESYVRTKNKESFNSLVNAFKNLGKDFFERNGVEPVSIITLKEPINVELKDKICRFEEGEKFVYIVGERFPQKSANNLFDGTFNEDVEIHFTEYFPSEDIFENDGDNNIAIHEEFLW